MLSAVMLAVGLAPGAALAQTFNAPKGATVVSGRADGAHHVQPMTTNIVYDVRCYSWGCTVDFTTTPRWDRAQFWVGCSGGGGVMSPLWYGPGSGSLSASCAAYGFGSPTVWNFWYGNSNPWICTWDPLPWYCY